MLSLIYTKSEHYDHYHIRNSSWQGTCKILMFFIDGDPIITMNISVDVTQNCHPAHLTNTSINITFKMFLIPSPKIFFLIGNHWNEMMIKICHSFIRVIYSLVCDSRIPPFACKSSLKELFWNNWPFVLYNHIQCLYKRQPDLDLFTLYITGFGQVVIGSHLCHYNLKWTVLVLEVGGWWCCWNGGGNVQPSLKFQWLACLKVTDCLYV